MLTQSLEENLDKLYQNAPVVPINDKSKYIIMADFHLGAGKSRDDFGPNQHIVSYALKNYYLEQNYHLVLNGDVEELQKIRYSSILEAWHDLYQIFYSFKDKNLLTKLVGNHDLKLKDMQSELAEHDLNHQLQDAIRLEYNEQQLFILHGHQASQHKGLRQSANSMVLRYIAHPLHIKNFNRENSHNKPLKAEVVLFEYALKNKLPIILAHTHRTLFQGSHILDELNHKLDATLREMLAHPHIKKSLQKELDELKERISLYEKDRLSDLQVTGKYGTSNIPLLFNTGTVFAAEGSYAIEISNGEIALVLWVDLNKNRREDFAHLDVLIMDNVPYAKIILKRETLSFIFHKIRLLLK